jgi:mannose-6-phosphate isomerase-like protein (cupin superfamily)
MARTRSSARLARPAKSRRAAPGASRGKRKTASAVPAARVDRDRGFARGKFHLTHEQGAYWDTGLREYFAYRDLGMAEATGGKLRAHVIRPSRPCDKPGDLHYHALDFQMVYVLKGWARVHFEGIGERRLEAGSCMYQEPGILHRVLEYSDDYTVIEITVPADFETVSVAP